MGRLFLVYNFSMESSWAIWVGMIIGGGVGGYIPVLWGAGYFSFASILFNAIGAIIGIWVVFKLTH